ncbi:MAG: phosphatidylserine decarboxylase [Flavobacteriales bacterium]|jgi:phosphatidylserine decarboxylase
MRIHKEGYTILLTTLFIVVGIHLLSHHFVTTSWLDYLINAVALVFFILVLQFFRNPKRNTVAQDFQLIAPADGKLVVIEKTHESEYFKDDRIQLSIFMSPLNVHVNRYPMNGVVKFSKYHPGKFLVAWHPKSSTENERTTVVVDSPTMGLILFRQIAGAVARRIVNYAKVDDQACVGDDFGFIKFGSRVDLLLPLNAKIKVELNQAIKGGVTVLAEIPKG